jgi:hypothetical protein
MPPGGLGARHRPGSPIHQACRDVMGNNKADSRQLPEIGGKLIKVPLRCAGCGERFPWIMSAWRACLNISDEALAGGDELTGGAWRVECMIFVIPHTLHRSAKQREIIWLTGMRQSKGFGQTGRPPMLDN